MRARAADVERAFATQLGVFATESGVARAPLAAVTVPSAVAHLVSAVHGLERGEHLRSVRASLAFFGVDRDTPKRARKAIRASAGFRAAASTPAPPPTGFRTNNSCSAFSGEKLDRTDPPYGGGFASPLPFAPCGYGPPDIRSAYGVDATVARGIDGTGVTVAVMDSVPRVPQHVRRRADLREELTDPTHPLTAAQFHTVVGPGTTPPVVDLNDESGWYTEQQLDVEAVHVIAPGANILYVGAVANGDQPFVDALNFIIDGSLASVISNSWDGFESDPTANVTAYTDIATQAGLKGIAVLFSSGDDGDESTSVGVPTLDFPAALPLVTAVGGTSIGIGADRKRTFELGWETAASRLDTTTTPGTYAPAAPGGFSSGAGGGTSRIFAQPTYQAGIVPAAIAKANGAPAKRALPDVAMLADPSTGMLIGETQTFPEGVKYDQFTHRRHRASRARRSWPA